MMGKLNWLALVTRKPISADLPAKQELKTEVFEYIESFYNRKRSRSRLGWISPADFEGEAFLPFKKLTR